MTLTLAEPGGARVEKQRPRGLYDTPTATPSLPVVFTVLTSPDSDKASMYDHMPGPIPPAAVRSLSAAGGRRALIGGAHGYLFRNQ